MICGKCITYYINRTDRLPIRTESKNLACGAFSWHFPLEHFESSFRCMKLPSRNVHDTPLQAFWHESGNQWALLRRVTHKKPREAWFLNAGSAAIFWKPDISSASESVFSINLGNKFTRFTASKIAGLYLHRCEMLTLRVLSSIPTSILADTATHCNIHIDRYYNTWQRTSTHSNTLQHKATHYIHHLSVNR